VTAAPPATGAGWLVALAMVLTGLTMRTSVTSVGAVLDDLRAGLHVGSGLAGLITTLPVICFALIGTAAPRIAHHVGEHLLLIASLLLMTVGLVLRALAGTVWLFLLLSVLALSGSAISNVLMPSLVKRHFPSRVGAMTAAYTTAMAIGLTAAAGLSVPIGHLTSSDGWRLGLGSWALLSAVAVLPWLPSLRGDRPEQGARRGLPAVRLVHSRTAWALALFFGAQSFQAYIAFGWFATFLRDHGASAGHAGLLIAFFSALSIPVSIVVPLLAVRGQRPLVVALTGCYFSAYVGMLVAPIGGAWVWMLLAGTGSGMFPLALTMIGLRSRAAETTGALSAFTQGVGYLFAATGPLLVGVLLGGTDNWSAPFAMLFAVLAVAAGAGWIAAREHYVDDELVPARLRDGA
jgi:CP family cyanate transporter-like MFS transporter